MKTEKKNIKLFLLGAPKTNEFDKNNDLLIRMIENVNSCNIILANEITNADIVIAYPYIANTINFKIRWLISIIFLRKKMKADGDFDFNWLVGANRKPLLFVCHENLDKPFWWMRLGRFLVRSNTSRLTFWPKNIDPVGCRFPYWYNYVNWPQYSRETNYPRFGKLYDINQLLQPLAPQANDRLEKAVMVSSHNDFPRRNIIKKIQKTYNLDIWGNGYRSFKSDKLTLLKKYRYNVCPENSVGMGYDTEKLPEAWLAGCIPTGYFLNPYSDFNPDVLLDEEQPFKKPLLKTTPKLDEIEKYLGDFFAKHFPNYSRL